MLACSLLFGTPLLRVDLVKPDIQINSLKLRELGSAEQNATALISLAAQKVPTLGRLIQAKYLVRNDEVSEKFDTLATQAHINFTEYAGQWKLLGDHAGALLR